MRERFLPQSTYTPFECHDGCVLQLSAKGGGTGPREPAGQPAGVPADEEEEP